ncbi:MAG: hypothetical protein WA782_12460 [Sulfitobacter sp.]
MVQARQVVLIMGSGPNVTVARAWPKAWFGQIIAINNAWRIRPDWDALVFPEDFAAQKLPPVVKPQQQLVEADAFVAAQNLFGGFVHAGATMAFTTGYWALAQLRPRVMAFVGCDMVYPATGPTHFYGNGTADPLRDDVTLRDLGAQSARLAVIAAAQGCTCVNLSQGESSLLFPIAAPDALGGEITPPDVDPHRVAALRAQESVLDYGTPDGRYPNNPRAYNMKILAEIDAKWREMLQEST